MYKVYRIKVGLIWASEKTNLKCGLCEGPWKVTLSPCNFLSDRSVFVILGEPLGLHLIVYVNEMTFLSVKAGFIISECSMN